MQTFKISYFLLSRSLTDNESMDSSKHPSSEGPQGDARGSHKTLCGSQTGDIASATFLDVAVLRCLFIAQWQEEGVYWALHFLYNRSVTFVESKAQAIVNSGYFSRLRDINEEMVGQQQPRRRSNSLPIPKIEISFYQSPEAKRQETNLEVPEVKDLSLLTGR